MEQYLSWKRGEYAGRRWKMQVALVETVLMEGGESVCSETERNEAATAEGRRNAGGSSGWK